VTTNSQPEPRAVYTTCEVKAETKPGGLLLSLQVAGDFDGPDVNCRFFATGHEPPGHLTPEQFWGPVFADIAAHLGYGKPWDAPRLESVHDNP
jgi:hypothetical protein